MNDMQLKFNDIPDHSLAGERPDGHTPEPGGESPESPPYQGAELWTLLEGFLGAIIRAVSAKAGVVRVLSPDGRELQMVGAAGLPPEVCEQARIVDMDCGACGKAAYSMGVSASAASACAQRYRCHFSGEDCKYVVAVPLEFGNGKVGVFTIFFAGAQDIPDDVSRTFKSFAELIGIVLENTRQNRENRRISQMAERQSMANEIHDSLAQTLVYTKMRMNLLLEALRTQNEQLAIECAHDVDEALDSGQKTVRELITHFRCRMDPLGLQHALQALADEYCARTGIALEYANWVADIDLPLEHELQVFYIVREALANIAAHSGATRAQLAVHRNDGRYVFTIEDNGGGGRRCAPVEGHYGLLIMRERALRIGGDIEVKSSEHLGTHVRLSFPDPDVCKEQEQ